MCKIDKLMWVICKSGCVKQKKQVFSCKIDRKFRRTDVSALCFSLFFGLISRMSYQWNFNAELILIITQPSNRRYIFLLTTKKSVIDFWKFVCLNKRLFIAKVTIQNFWPPATRSQFHINFNSIQFFKCQGQFCKFLVFGHWVF